jgi:hypothetical protein
VPDAESVLNYKLEQRAEGTVEVAEKRDGDPHHDRGICPDR